MNNFSDKEYQNLRQDTAEIRNCITRYIGYIISVTGFSGVLKYFFEDQVSAAGNLMLLIITMIIITFLFEVIWYKFKSHNRFVGYMQLLMQEMDAIPLKVKGKNFISKENLEKKHYIKDYQYYLDQKPEKGIKDFYSWEFVMSRLHSSYFAQKEGDDQTMALKKAVNKCKFVFSISKSLYPFIEVKNHGTEFFNKVIFELYLKDTSKSFIPNLHKYLDYLYSTEKRILLNSPSIEKKYVVNGWRYPKKITQIGFTAITIIFGYFIYSLSNYFAFLGWNETLNFNFSISNLLPVFLFIAACYLFFFWLLKYVRNLKELVYGKHSIDFYCWMFFIYRTQLLNNRGVIPVIFSRSFVRYFKNDLYGRILKANYRQLERILPKSIVGENYEYLKKYKKYLKANASFTNDTSKCQNCKSIHCIMVFSFHKAEEKGIIDTGNLLIPQVILEKALKKEMKNIGRAHLA